MHGWTLEHFLTERYCLYASDTSVGGSAGKLYRGEVHHGPWPLQPAAATLEINTLVESAGLEGITGAAPHLLFARSLDVRVWRPQRV